MIMLIQYNIIYSNHNDNIIYILYIAINQCKSCSYQQLTNTVNTLCDLEIPIKLHKVTLAWEPPCCIILLSEINTLFNL